MNLKPEVIWKARKNGSMLYNVRTKNKLKLNEMATNILLTNYVNRHEAEAIAEGIQLKYPDMEYKDVLEDVNAILKVLEESEFTTESEDERGYINLIETARQLDYVNFQVTKRCNLNCIQCLESGNQVKEELSTKKVCEIIDDLSSFKVLEVVWTGGEPLVRGDMDEIINYATKKNIRSVLFTNGVLINDEFLESVKDANLFIRFSLDGATEEVNDAIRGKGTYKSTLEKIKKCKERNIPVGIASTINQINFGQYEQIIELAEKLEVDEVELSEVSPIGYAEERKDLLLTQDQLNELRLLNLKYSFISERFRKGMGFDGSMNEELLDDNNNRKYSCRGGILTCFIDTVGDMYPCRMFSDFEEFKVGNLLKENLIRLWNESPVLDRLRQLTIDKIESCVGCECYAECPGGCRAKAYKHTGCLDGKMTEDFCISSKFAFDKLKKGEGLQ